MNTLELFSGTKSFSKEAKKRGYKTYTIDIDNTYKPDLIKDILEVQAEDIPYKPNILWASPPCTTFSVASLRHYWYKGYPKNSKTWHGISMVLKTLQLIEILNPDYWFIENPRGMLRKQKFMPAHYMKTVSYCQYRDIAMKPTDIWSNCLGWKPKPICKAGDPCHEPAIRGANSGTQGKGGGSKNGALARGAIPPKLINEILDYCQKHKDSGSIFLK